MMKDEDMGAKVVDKLVISCLIDLSVLIVSPTVSLANIVKFVDDFDDLTRIMSVIKDTDNIGFRKSIVEERVRIIKY